MTFFRPSQNLLGYFAIFSIAAILLLPALHYSLDTPFGLVDRSTYLSYKLIDKEKFDYYLDQTFTFTDPERLEWSIRFRPFMDIWNGLIWKYFGDDGFFHRLNRWLFAFGTAAFLIAAFRSNAKIAQGCGQTVSNRLQLAQVIPVAILAYVWLFFPNPSFTLIESADLYTAFFLGVSNYAAALMLTARREGGGGGQGPCVVLHGLSRFAAFQGTRRCLGGSAARFLLWLGDCERFVGEENRCRARVDSDHSCCLMENNCSLGNG